MIAIEQSLGLWIPQVQGRYVNEDWNAENDGFGAQCWDLAANWSKYLGLPVISTGGQGRWPGWAGNMVDAFPQSNEIAAAYELVGPDQQGLPGDIAVWGDSYWYYPKTHVAVLIADQGGHLLCVSQNSTASQAGNPYPQWTTGPATIQHLPKQGLIGYLRPHLGIAAMGGTTTPTQEDDMATVPQEEWEWAKAVLSSLADNAATKKDLGEVPNKVLTQQVPYKDPITGQDTGQSTSLATMAGYADFQATQTRLNTNAKTVAASIPDSIAQGVIDALAARLGGK